MRISPTARAQIEQGGRDKVNSLCLLELRHPASPAPGFQAPGFLGPQFIQRNDTISLPAGHLEGEASRFRKFGHSRAMWGQQSPKNSPRGADR